MSRPKIFALVGLATAALAGCAPAKRYRPAPINPLETARRLETRRLSDPALRQFVEVNLGRPLPSWPMQRWDLQTLTLAALYFNPQMEVAREKLAVAQGGIVTAGEHPNPSVSLNPGIPSPYLFALPFVFPIETHGKRALRIEEAKHLSSAAQIALGESAWSVASGVRKALLAYRAAGENLALEQSTERLETERVTLLERVLIAGEGARPAVEAARLTLANVRFALRGDEGQVAAAKTALAAAIGVSVAALEGVELAWPNLERLPSLASLSPKRIQRDAVLNRLDVRRALAQYVAADAALRLQLARQYPDFNIGPGYEFEEGDNFFRIPFSIVLPIRNRNQGPIAQAEAFRKQAAANFLAVQARAIAQSQQALARYRAALAELEQANRPLEEQQRRVEFSEHALAAGEADRLQLNTLQLEGALYARQHIQALARAQAALGALEDAVERPLAGEEFLPAGNLPAASSAPKGGKR
jgi:cobalt-zinc-cadmium efflux system outer membrane protein